MDPGRMQQGISRARDCLDHLADVNNSVIDIEVEETIEESVDRVLLALDLSGGVMEARVRDLCIMLQVMLVCWRMKICGYLVPVGPDSPVK